VYFLSSGKEKIENGVTLNRSERHDASDRMNKDRCAFFKKPNGKCMVYSFFEFTLSQTGGHPFKLYKHFTS